MAWPGVKDGESRFRWHNYAQLVLVYYGVFHCFSASDPFGLWHRSADKITGTGGRRCSPKRVSEMACKRGKRSEPHIQNMKRHNEGVDDGV